MARKNAKEESEFNKWRKKKGLSLADISRKAGIYYMTVARWSSGVNKRPRMAYREKLRKVFPGCPLAD